MTRVTLRASKSWTNKVALTKLIRNKSQLDLAEAKGCTDQLLEGREVVIAFASTKEAKAFSHEASELGIITEIEEL